MTVLARGPRFGAAGPLVVLAAVSAGTLLPDAGPIAAEPSSPWTESAGIASARMPRIAAACRDDAQRQARSEKRWGTLEWIEAGRPKVEEVGSRGGSGLAVRVDIAGRARTAHGWVAVTAHCKYAKDRPVEVTLEAEGEWARGIDLNLSGIVAPPAQRTAPQTNALPLPRQPPTGDAPEAAASSGIKPVLREIPPDPLTLNKRGDFLRDHQFGIQLDAPF